MILARKGIGATFVALTAVAGLLAGCGRENNSGVQMSTTLTESAARNRIDTYLLDTLRGLPSGVGLSRTPDHPDLSSFGPNDAALTVPCDDNNDDPRHPVQAVIAYWITGVPRGQDNHYFELTRTYWTDRGYRLNPDSTSDWASVDTPDRYSLSIESAGKGYGSLSITAGSPCFPQAAKGTTTPQPTELERPS
ncbi:hypothetical protein [Nocardia macrotermitis]|uniref:Lipoprotein n=1 Tax=Nocardia macrotermitis TaxID=2585198 RepID=A0A7K0DAU1_9NOCA|nr:hypothetical protein [Nocardia macrotermitis]MQY22905.1 hypothetical protein [Nocardia macrotermitis]